MLASPPGHSGRLLSSVTIAALIAAAPAVAQDSANVTRLDTIVIGAGTPKVAIDTPQAVTVVDQDDLDREQPRTVGDIFREVPGVSSAGASERPLGQVFNIRGIGKADDAASESRIVVTVDGVPKFFQQYRTGSFFGDPALFKRVEVLRGPAASTLYGSGAIGGVINFTTKDAADLISEGKTQVVRGRLAYGSQGDAAQGTLTWASKLGDTADLLASFSTGTSGTVEDGAGDEIPSTDFDRWSLLLKGNYHFGEARDKTLTLSLARTETDVDKAAVAQTGGSAAVLAGFGTSNLHAKDDTVVLRYRDRAVENPWLDIDVQLSFTDTSTKRDNFEYAMFCSPGRMQVLCDNEARYKTTVLKAENTIEMSAGAWRNFLTFGAEYSHQNRAAWSSQGVQGYHPGGTNDRLAGYVQGEFVWNDRLTITPGLRVERGSLSPDAQAKAGAAASGHVVGDEDSTVVSPKISALYQLTESWGVFGSVARTERMPTLDELYSWDATRVPSLDLDKERATSLELGVTWQRHDLFSTGDALTAKVTAFHNDIKDMIAANPSVAGLPYYHNIDDAKIWGAEIEAEYEADRWFAALAYSKVKSKDKATDLQLDTTPAETVALTLGAKFPDQGVRLSWRVRAASGITNWTKASTGVSSEADTSGAGYGVHDLFASWTAQEGALAGLQVNVGIENVFDREYRDNLSLDNASGRDVVLSVAKAFEW